MYFYELSLLNSPLNYLTYKTETLLDIGTVVEVKLRNRNLNAVVIASCDTPDFKTNGIENILPLRYSSLQIKMAKFIATYYFCSVGEALNLFTPFDVTSEIENGAWEMGESAIVLSSKQQDALSLLKQHPVSLLFGDTGAGKTEIYMKYFEEVLA